MKATAARYEAGVLVEVIEADEHGNLHFPHSGTWWVAPGSGADFPPTLDALQQLPPGRTT